MTDLSILPSSVPFLNPDGTNNTQWYLFLQQLYVRTGGGSSQTNNDLARGLADDAGIEEIKFELFRVLDQLNQYQIQVQNLIDEISLIPASNYDPAALYVTGGQIDGVTIGNNSASTGKFTDITNGNAAALIKTSVAMNNGAGASAGTIANAPTAGNPTKWIPISDNGTTRYVPAW